MSPFSLLDKKRKKTKWQTVEETGVINIWTGGEFTYPGDTSYVNYHGFNSHKENFLKLAVTQCYHIQIDRYYIITSYS